MAVAYHHRLVAAGPLKELKEFRDAIGLTVTRRPAVKIPEWREYVPISFAAMYARCPRLARVERNLPYDPYDISWWPKRSLPNGRYDIRYQFYIRNLEMKDFLGPFSQEFPQLEFRLVIFCLDDSMVDSYLIRAGKVRKYTLPEQRSEWHWEQARGRFGIAGDEVYADDEACAFAEEGMLEESLDHWELTSGNGAAASRPGASVEIGGTGQPYGTLSLKEVSSWPRFRNRWQTMQRRNAAQRRNGAQTISSASCNRYGYVALF